MARALLPGGATFTGFETARGPMALFYFNVCRNGVWTQDRDGGEYADCGMAFRAARAMIGRLRVDEQVPDHKLRAMRLQVTYSDRSELFDLPFDLGI